MDRIGQNRWLLWIYTILFVVCAPALAWAATGEGGTNHLSSGERIYTVVPGDTLWGLSRSLDVPMKQLIEQNHVANPNLIRVGEKLVYRPALHVQKSNGQPIVARSRTDAFGMSTSDQPTADQARPTSSPVTRRTVDLPPANPISDDNGSISDNMDPPTADTNSGTSDTNPATSDASDVAQGPSSTARSSVLYCTLTAYTAGPESTGKAPGDAGYGITSTGQRAVQGLTVAVDPHVIPYGTELFIPGVGLRVAEDTGGAIVGHHIDVFYNDVQVAREFGVKRNIPVFVVAHPHTASPF